MVDIATIALRAAPRRVLSAFETWPAWLFYAPMPPLWLFLAARHGGLTLPTIANTARPLSGFLGESKSEGLGLLGPEGLKRVAQFATFETSETGNVRETQLRANAAMAKARLSFPFAVKPDVGQNGAGVKIVRDHLALEHWLDAYPRGTRVMLQTFIDSEGEAGVFYARRPNEEKGCILSLTLKQLPSVRGDGVSTLRELILADARARRLRHLYFPRNLNRLHQVVPKGKRVRLVSVGNHCRGAVFRNGAKHITPELERAFDAIAREIPGFYFGRFDVKFASLAAFERAEEFSIIEINGADAEMTHIWDAEQSLAGAYMALAQQYALAFEIGAMNRADGAVPVTLGQFLSAWLANRARLEAYPDEE